jgi:hypothetical protein
VSGVCVDICLRPKVQPLAVAYHRAETAVAIDSGNTFGKLSVDAGLTTLPPQAATPQLKYQDSKITSMASSVPRCLPRSQARESHCAHRGGKYA